MFEDVVVHSYVGGLSFFFDSIISEVISEPGIPVLNFGYFYDIYFNLYKKF